MKDKRACNILRMLISTLNLFVVKQTFFANFAHDGEYPLGRGRKIKIVGC